MAMSPPDERKAPAPTLRAPANLVSRRAVTYWTVRAAEGWLLLLVGQVAWFWLDDSHRGLRAVALLVTVLVAAGHLVVMPRWRYRVHRWEVSPIAVYTQSGWLTQERRIAPISRIQTVDSQRGPLEQLFGLTNVTVTTASAAGPLHIKGLDDATAQRLVRELTTVTAAAEDDAT
jgi:membrane protein YdbS with pleckstrin-like domain